MVCRDKRREGQRNNMKQEQGEMSTLTASNNINAGHECVTAYVCVRVPDGSARPLMSEL